MQKSIGYGARAERKEEEGRGRKREIGGGVGTQNWPLMESKHYRSPVSLKTAEFHHSGSQTTM